MRLDEKTVKKVEQILLSKKNVYRAVMHVESGDGHLKWSTAIKDMKVESKFFIASVTKLYITAVIIQLIDQKKIQLNDPISKYVSNDIIEGLHVLRGVDSSNVITIKHLLSNTSGLPDYFFHKLEDKKTFASKILNNEDVFLSFEETIGYVKKLKPNFYPGEKRKAAYSDTNYQLLGEIIEVVTNKTIHEVFDETIFKPLNLHNTTTYQDPTDTSPVLFYYKDKELHVPNYMKTITPEGGIVSTAEEVMIFIKAFFKGKFFNVNEIEKLKDWRIIFPPPSLFYFGIGLEKLFIPRFVSPFKPIKEVLGFWGQTGSFAFYHPQTDLHFTGTTNQIDGSGHAAVIKAMLVIIKANL